MQEVPAVPKPSPMEGELLLVQDSQKLDLVTWKGLATGKSLRPGTVLCSNSKLRVNKVLKM